LAKNGSMGAMPEGLAKGLKRWGKGLKTAQIAEHLEDKDVDDPQALAVWVRRRALGEAEFKRHQAEARKKKG
jgi:hypothetical protein